MSSKGRSTRKSQQPIEDDAAQEPDNTRTGNDRDEEEAAAPPKSDRSNNAMGVGRSLESENTPEMAMEMLVDRLKLLDYERDFCKRKKPFRKPLNRFYFALPLSSGNQGEQFFYFTSLCSWLLGLAGVEVPAPKEFDDPNQTCNSIIGACKRLGFAAPGYAPMKLTSGYGREVCGVLEGLAAFVLEKKNFTFKAPVYLPESYADEVEDDEMDAGIEQAQDEFQLPDYADDENEEEAYMAAEGLAPPPSARGAGKAVELEAAAGKEILHSQVDPLQWKLEMERVAPKLRILLNADSKDWRANLEEVHTNSKTISSAWPESRVVLEKLRGELNGSLEKLTTREHYLNEQFDRLMDGYRAQRKQLSEIQSTHNSRTEAVSDRNNELHRIGEQLSEMKTMMDERGTNISDATPVVRIKGGIKKLSEELHDMEVRIGVVSHTLLQLSLKNRRLMTTQAAAAYDSDLEE